MNTPISWEEWNDNITLEDQERIALQIGMTNPDGTFNLVTDRMASVFQDRCDALIRSRIEREYANKHS